MDKHLNVNQSYLGATAVIDYYHPEVQQLSKELANNNSDTAIIAKNCFEWVRDSISHSVDVQRTEVSCSASEVLQMGHGFCYAKSHLLAALLRANDINAGFCYQRLSDDRGGYALHGFNTVYLPHLGWYRVDARGNKPGVNAQFEPPHEQLAFSNSATGEIDYGFNFSEPWPTVVRALRQAKNVQQLLRKLPDKIHMG